MWVVLRALLALGALGVAYHGEMLLEGRQRIEEGVLYFVAAATLLIAADLRRARANSAAPPPPASRRDRVGWWVLLLVVFGLGCFYRVYQLASAPWGVWFDEAQNGIVAQRILNDPQYRPVFVGDASQLPALFFYVYAVSIKFFGANILAIRLVATVSGILTLIFVYLLSRELFDQRVAVLATFFLAVMRWHVNFSRFGMHGIFMPLFMTAMFYFLVRGLKGKRFLNFVAAGVMAGIGLQGYYSFLLVPGVVGLYLLHYLLFQRVITWGRLIVGVLAFGLATAGVYSPVAIYALRNPQQFNQRLGTVSITRDRTPQQIAEVLWRTTSRHLLMFNSSGDGNGRHNAPGAPMVDTYTGLLFVLGFGYSLWRCGRSGYFLLVVWMAVIIQGGIWSLEFEAPQGYRTVGLTPAVAMLAAVPLGVLWSLAADCASDAVSGGTLRRIGSYAMTGAVLMVTLFALGATAWTNFDMYFNKQLQRADAWASYSTDATFVGREVARLGHDYVIYCSPFLAGLPTITFLAPDVPDPHRFEAARDLPVTSTKPAVFLLSYSERPVFDLLKGYYPKAKFVEFGPPDGGSAIALEAILSEDDIAATRGLTYRYATKGASREGRTETLDLDWTSTPPLAPPFQAEWLGILKVPTYGVYSLEVQAPGSVEISLDGKQVASGDGMARSSDLVLAQGLHNLNVRSQVSTTGRVRLLWQNENAPPQPVPGTELFSAPVKRQGLEGSYFSDIAPEGLKFVRIDPFPGGHMHILPLSIPFSIRWQGQIELAASGSYRFIVQAVDAGSLTIDGKQLLTTQAPNQPAEGTIELAAGAHRVAIDYHQRGGSPAYINILWQPPRGGIETVPATMFAPPS
jgi:dolichyl-phosphate-mannose-protein mannosyltransferase/PA14 domain-containing protein